jgi:hypothetical protein
VVHFDAAASSANAVVGKDEVAVSKVDHLLRVEPVALPWLLNHRPKPEDAVPAPIAILEIHADGLTDEIELDLGISGVEEGVEVAPVPCLAVVTDGARQEFPPQPGAGREAQKSRRVQSRQGLEPQRETFYKVAAAVVTFAGLGAQTAGAATDICVAANDEVRHQSGTANCVADGTGSVAIAKGDNSIAFAIDGDRNRAMVHGDGSSAGAGDGDGNTATVRGDGSGAGAGIGDDNTATVRGDGSFAFAGTGDGNTATVRGDGSFASAGRGDDNTATASGDGCAAAAAGGNGLSDSCP